MKNLAIKFTRPNQFKADSNLELLKISDYEKTFNLSFDNPAYIGISFLVS
jgi:hypothetical protein